MLVRDYLYKSLFEQCTALGQSGDRLQVEKQFDRIVALAQLLQESGAHLNIGTILSIEQHKLEIKKQIMAGINSGEIENPITEQPFQTTAFLDVQI